MQNSQQMWTFARANKGGINLNVEFRRQKAWTNSGCKKHNFNNTEPISKILEVTLQQSLAMPDKAKYCIICGNKPHNLHVTQF